MHLRCNLGQAKALVPCGQIAEPLERMLWGSLGTLQFAIGSALPRRWPHSGRTFWYPRKILHQLQVVLWCHRDLSCCQPAVLFFSPSHPLASPESVQVWLVLPF